MKTKKPNPRHDGKAVLLWLDAELHKRMRAMAGFAGQTMGAFCADLVRQGTEQAELDYRERLPGR